MSYRDLSLVVQGRCSFGALDYVYIRAREPEEDPRPFEATVEVVV